MDRRFVVVNLFGRQFLKVDKWWLNFVCSTLIDYVGVLLDNTRAPWMMALYRIRVTHLSLRFCCIIWCL